ncbi:MAG: DUF2806 domain-containing protein [Pseudolabrys sp.]|nr:DUF2806 domain-containing protein [Pseudolabrys sp.]
MSDEASASTPSVWSTLNLPKIFLGPAGEAISRLIGRAADIPDAKIASHVQKIKDDTAARSIVTKAIAEAVAKNAASDPVLVERAMESFVRKEFRKQENKEAVAQKTIEALADTTSDSHEQTRPATPDADWMNVFESHAEKASTERMRDIWGQVLAGEIRKPKSFSLKTLNFISQLDQRIATLFEKYAKKVCFGDSIPKSHDLKGETLSELLQLEEFGLVSNVAGTIARNPILTPQDTGLLMTVGSGHLALVRAPTKAPDAIAINVPVIPLTSVGREIYSIVLPRFDLEAAREIAKEFPKENLSRISVFDSVSQTETEVLWEALAVVKEPKQ